MRAKVATSVELDTITCGACGMLFGVPPRWLEERREDKKGWCCPNGHGLVFGESETDRLKRELAQRVAQLDQIEAELEYETRERKRTQKQLASTRGVLTKTKQRISNGVCPCCHRHFTNVARHMAGQHPDYATEVP